MDVEDFGQQLPELRTPPPGPRSRASAERLAEVESRNVTYVADDWPVFWADALGSNVRDVDGNVFLDLTSAFGVAFLGHRPPVLEAALREETLVHGMGDIHPPQRKLELLERLASIAPFDEAKTILANTGSEAVEAALKTASLATGRPGVIAFEGGYPTVSVRTTDAKYIHFDQLDDELYDLRNDPTETVNLAPPTDPEGERLRQIALAVVAQRAEGAETIELTEEQIRELKALGYIH